MKKLLLVLMLLLSTAINAFAVEVEIGGLWYDVITKAKEAKVIQNKNNIKYSGSIVIPESVEYDGVTCSVTSIGSGAFWGCSGLTSVTIPNSVTSIGNYAFSGTGLTSVTIPNSVTSIGDYAFSGCSKLTSVTIPNSVTSIEDYAFFNCSGLTSVSVDAGNTVYDSRDNCNAIIETASNTLITGCKNTIIPNSVTSIERCAFQGCSGLTSVTIGNSVTSIGNQAFSHCSGLTSVTIGNSVTSIGNQAFYCCSGLTSVTIPNSVTSIGESAFSGTGLTSVSVDAGNTVYDSRDNCNAIIETASNTLITGCKSTIIPNSVTSIGEGAFERCSGLTSVTIGNSVTSIEGYAFYGCSGLTSVTIGNSVTSIGERAFSGCFGLTSVTIPNSVTSIGSYAFSYCSALTSVTIPNSVTSIGYDAFSYCSALTSVTIGSGIKNISFEAFAKCTELTDVYCYAKSVPSTESNAFADSYIENVTLHVPTASIDAYKAAAPWSGFKTIVGLDGTSPETKKCATPTISLVDGELQFSCETEGVEYVSEVSFVDGKKYYDNEVSLTGVYKVSVYATKTGYDNSDVAKAEFTMSSGSGIKGDVNGDGKVDVSDVVGTANIILQKQ